MFLEFDGNTVHTNFYEPVSKMVFLLSSIFWDLPKTISISQDSLGQSIQEWIKYNLWKTAFKNFEVTWSV